MSVRNRTKTLKANTIDAVGPHLLVLASPECLAAVCTLPVAYLGAGCAEPMIRVTLRCGPFYCGIVTTAMPILLQEFLMQAVHAYLSYIHVITPLLTRLNVDEP